ncbi:serine hydroxymethyltransferase [Saccharopolyspora sp. NFXS83]|uniref:serine hydroxymethyltransferase n=1 Tax=Saccharopolyspora sp. NFXS83 TaxID=2993560 RepID=UPI00224B9CDF|nr:serine hydroxymethyltransferase [Saccharopolyspora sp. NFXS83]MCX2730635.1 serine hydroxymethyltransferase [Saccharopolyspora sp. NFXS83]
MLSAGTTRLRVEDPELAGLLDDELTRQDEALSLVASAGVADASVLAAGAAALSDVTAEGYPGSRFHPGAERFDAVERLAAARARAAFGASHANVQPHSCSAANLAVLTALLPVGGVLLGLRLDAGGHLTHGAPASVTGRWFRPVSYGVGDDGLIDYAAVARVAREHRPGVIVAGASAHPRRLDHVGFREIADEVGAYLLADVSHVAGLVAAGLHPNPIDVAHVTTMSTYKQLDGPRGGLILLGREHDHPGPDGTPLARLIDRAVFPGTQGTPAPAAIAAKARALDRVREPEFERTARLVLDDAAALATALRGHGYRLLTGGTDTHMVVLDLRPGGPSGLVAERALEECGILANRNSVPGDTRPPTVTSGLRLGTNVLARRGMGPAEMAQCARLVDRVLRCVAPVDATRYRLDPAVRAEVRAEVRELTRSFPLPGRPVPEGVR